MQELYRYDKYFTNEYVLTGTSALERAGLVLANLNNLDLQTAYSDADHLKTVAGTYYYNPCIDYNYCLQPSESNPLLLKPTKERALVECILHLDWIDEGLLIEGLQTYINQFWNEKKLYEAADHFGLDYATLEYWLEEARNDCEV